MAFYDNVYVSDYRNREMRDDLRCFDFLGCLGLQMQQRLEISGIIRINALIVALVIYGSDSFTRVINK